VDGGSSWRERSTLPMNISRKEFLKLGLVAGVGLVRPFGVALTGNLLRSKTRLPEPFRVPLPVPPVLQPAPTPPPTTTR
jgi:hypothetical protein